MDTCVAAVNEFYGWEHNELISTLEKELKVESGLTVALLEYSHSKTVREIARLSVAKRSPGTYLRVKRNSAQPMKSEGRRRKMLMMTTIFTEDFVKKQQQQQLKLKSRHQSVIVLKSEYIALWL